MVRFLAVMCCLCCSAPKPTGSVPKPVDAGVADAGFSSPTVTIDTGLLGSKRLAWTSESLGNPQVVINGRPITRGASHFLQAVSSQGLFVTALNDGTESLQYLDFDGGVRWATEPRLRAHQVTVSPDESMVAFESGTSERISDIALVNVATGLTTQFTSEKFGSFEPALSNQWLAFVSSRDGDSEVYVKEWHAKKPIERRLTAFHLEDFRPVWNPTGRALAFISNREGSDRIFVVSPDGRSLKRLNPANSKTLEEADVNFSTDGQIITFSAREPLGHWQLFSAEGGMVRQLTHLDFDAQNPQRTVDGTVAFVGTQLKVANIFLLSADAGVSQLTSGASSQTGPKWVP
jgi:TolB protein